MPLLARVRAVLQSRHPLARRPDGEPVDPEVLAATAALLVAAAHGDHEVDPAERQAIQKSLRTAFGISREEAAGLLTAVDAPDEPDIDLAQTAATITSVFDEAGRQRVLGLFWTVVYADHIVDDAEVSLASEVTRLLGLNAEQCQEARDKAFEWFSVNRSRE
jgi:uncharacterized tellurite resistance protein B-like protein